MRLLVEASYETRRITGVVEGNNLARVNAEKKLESDSKATSRAERERWSKIQVKAKGASSIAVRWTKGHATQQHILAMTRLIS